MTYSISIISSSYFQRHEVDTFLILSRKEPKVNPPQTTTETSDPRASLFFNHKCFV